MLESLPSVRHRLITREPSWKRSELHGLHPVSRGHGCGGSSPVPSSPLRGDPDGFTLRGRCTRAAAPVSLTLLQLPSIGAPPGFDPDATRVRCWRPPATPSRARRSGSVPSGSA
ncbi:hypothetical protein ACFFX0_26165 [Citricoccus parietis]|uniref:Uncharacterized protein n=1 Tax=Citricoccus parietis TaxID=592307 RepID=A0ABV5G6D0_9MICC